MKKNKYEFVLIVNTINVHKYCKRLEIQHTRAQVLYGTTIVHHNHFQHNRSAAEHDE